MNHTPTPWKLSRTVDGFLAIAGPDDKNIASIGCDELFDGIQHDAQHIVRCVNSHDALVEALRDLRAAVEEYREGKPNFGRLTIACDKADDALALGEKGE